MALPGDGDATYGVQFTITGVPTGATYTIERDVSGAFGSPVTIETGTGNRTISDVLPADGITRYYRAKVSQAGYVDSAWSSTVSQAPHEIDPPR